MSSAAPRLVLEFDDIIYGLQQFGGITQYWQQVTEGVERLDRFEVSRCLAPTWWRLLRVMSPARVFHSSYFRVARGPRVRNVVTVHDMAFERGLAGTGMRSQLVRLERRKAYFAADAMICGSENARQDLLAHFPSLRDRLITVAHHGPTLSADAPAAPLASLGQAAERPFVLFVGGRQHYKNFDGALRGYAGSGLAAEGVRLVCTGAPLSPEEQAQVHRFGLSGKVLSTGPIDRQSLVTLYRHAHCLLYPSTFEGFGMPVLEAMTLGCPVVAAHCTAIPEVAGNAALLVAGGEADGISHALLAMGDTGLRQRLINDGQVQARKFSWERSAELHAQVYLSLA
jgi:glycosyltransferase involved in cell wall biosynthesis